jgi:hypothetical protein
MCGARQTVRKTSTFSTTSTSFTDVTDLSITVTTGPCPVLLILSSTVNGSNLNVRTFLTFNVDGSDKGASTGGLVSARLPDGASSDVVTMTYLTDQLSAGSHTFKVRMRVSTGTGYLIADNDGEIQFTLVEM